MTTDQFMAAMEISRRASDAVPEAPCHDEIRFTYPFYTSDHEARWHCLLATSMDDGDETHTSGEFIGIGDSPQTALASAVAMAIDAIQRRAELDQEFLEEHAPDCPRASDDGE